MDNVTRFEAMMWVWSCPKCEADPIGQGAHVVARADSDSPDMRVKDHPDFEKRYEQPALAALEEKARRHNMAMHPAVTI